MSCRWRRRLGPDDFLDLTAHTPATPHDREASCNAQSGFRPPCPRLAFLETSFQDERAAKLQLEEDLATAQSTIQSQTKQIAALKLEDAGSETLAGKKKDKIDTGAEEVVFAHNAVADQFLG